LQSEAVQSSEPIAQKNERNWSLEYQFVRGYSDHVSTQELLQRITVDAEICHGKPCVRGLRYPVPMLLELLSSGMTVDDILTDYEDLEREDLLAALAYGAKLTDAKRIVLAP
jgi:uncharacterized protein (DUF433 family)